MEYMSSRVVGLDTTGPAVLDTIHAKGKGHGKGKGKTSSKGKR